MLFNFSIGWWMANSNWTSPYVNSSISLQVYFTPYVNKHYPNYSRWKPWVILGFYIFLPTPFPDLIHDQVFSLYLQIRFNISFSLHLVYCLLTPRPPLYLFWTTNRPRVGFLLTCISTYSSHASRIIFFIMKHIEHTEIVKNNVMNTYVSPNFRNKRVKPLECPAIILLSSALKAIIVF